MAPKRRQAGLRLRRAPQRTCVACRQVEGKRQLVRVVRTPTGTVEVDLTGKKNGRGAYLHADPSCWDLALTRKTLQHALKTEIAETDRMALTAFRDGLPPAQAPQDGATSTAASSTTEHITAPQVRFAPVVEESR